MRVPNTQGRLDYLPLAQRPSVALSTAHIPAEYHQGEDIFVAYCEGSMTDQPLTSFMFSIIKFLMSLFTLEDPETKKRGDLPTHVDPGGPFYEVICQSPEPPHLEPTTRPQEIVYSPSQHAHCDPQMMSEDYGRLMEHYKAVSQERDDLRNRARRMQDTIDQHVDHLRRSESTANTLQERFAATRAELLQVRQDLQASRSFVSTEDSDDGRTLVDMLSVLNQKIDEFAYVVGGLVPPEIGQAHFTPPKTEKGIADMGLLETLGAFAIRTDLSLADVLQYGIQHATCQHLLHELFLRFAPAMDRSLSDHLNELHRSLSLHYPQAYGGRWRAMTYSHIRSQSIEISEWARWWVGQTLAFVELCAPGCRPAEGTPEEGTLAALKKAEEIFRAALDLQDKAKTAYLAYNYEVFAVDPGRRFEEREMKYGGDDRKKQKGHGEVVAVLELGLKAWRSACGDEGQYMVIPAQVSVLTTAVLTTV